MNKLVIGAAVTVGVVALAGAAWAWTFRGIETPAYSAIKSDGAFELRDYPKLVVASFDAQGDRGVAVRRAFSPLADYIFAKKRSGEKIAMTAPVTQTPDADNWTVSFIMPAGRTLNDLPDPSGDVTLAEVAPRMMASYRFSGRWTDARFAEASDKLFAWVEQQGLTPAGEIEFAYYNDPFTPPFLRRNEVLIEVTR
ncbi:MAG: heme-binding protein [Pseudomonadota bacterium]